MTPLGTSISPLQPRGASHHGAWMRRIGGAAVTMALVVLGLGAGLWLGSPASAATGDIEVDMGDGIFVTSTPTKLLDSSALAPGGSVRGHMMVRDASDHDGSDFVDAITLMAVGVSYGDTCPLLTSADCSAASHALADKLSFGIAASGAGGTGTSTADLTSLTDVGVDIGSGMVHGNTLDVTVTVSLDKAVGNDVQYGSVMFNLALGLSSTTPEPSDGTTLHGRPDSDAGPAAVAGGAGPSLPEVASENQELGPDDVGSPGASSVGGKDILVLGESKSELPNTGMPAASLLAVGGAVLAAGLALVFAGRRRSA
jgi:LPXTG-motif cell wall-anchored protein